MAEFAEWGSCLGILRWDAEAIPRLLFRSLRKRIIVRVQEWYDLNDKMSKHSLTLTVSWRVVNFVTSREKCLTWRSKPLGYQQRRVLRIDAWHLGRGESRKGRSFVLIEHCEIYATDPLLNSSACNVLLSCTVCGVHQGLEPFVSLFVSLVVSFELVTNHFGWSLGVRCALCMIGCR